MSLLFFDNPFASFFGLPRRSRMVDSIFSDFYDEPLTELLSLPALSAIQSSSSSPHPSVNTSNAPDTSASSSCCCSQQSKQNKEKEDQGKSLEKQSNQRNEVFTWMPRSDVKETENAFVVTAELPGVPKENININIKDDVLTIEGKKEAVVESSSTPSSTSSTSSDENKETKEDNQEKAKEKETKTEPKKETPKAKSQWNRVERYYGSFRRSFTLPEGTVPSEIKATHTDGVLSISIPKVVHKEDSIVSIPIL